LVQRAKEKKVDKKSGQALRGKRGKKGQALLKKDSIS